MGCCGIVHPADAMVARVAVAVDVVVAGRGVRPLRCCEPAGRDNGSEAIQYEAGRRREVPLLPQSKPLTCHINPTNFLTRPNSVSPAPGPRTYQRRPAVSGPNNGRGRERERECTHRRCHDAFPAASLYKCIMEHSHDNGEDPSTNFMKEYSNADVN